MRMRYQQTARSTFIRSKLATKSKLSKGGGGGTALRSVMVARGEGRPPRSLVRTIFESKKTIGVNQYDHPAADKQVRGRGAWETRGWDWIVGRSGWSRAEGASTQNNP